MNTVNQIGKFIAVGGLNTLVGYSLYAFFVFIHFDYKLALFLATLFGIFFNFKTIGGLVFKDWSNTAFFKFALVYFMLFWINILAIHMISTFTPNLYVAGLIVIFPAALISFFINKLIVFKTPLFKLEYKHENSK